MHDSKVVVRGGNLYIQTVIRSKKRDGAGYLRYPVLRFEAARRVLFGRPRFIGSSLLLSSP
jgi:hypothetical protein